MKATVFLLRSAQALKPHVPLIKFRKGQQEHDIGTFKSAPSHSSNRKQDGQAIVLEDYQLPLRFRRLPLDENEIISINSGGSM